jgi:hypothetical protein
MALYQHKKKEYHYQHRKDVCSPRFTYVVKGVARFGTDILKCCHGNMYLYYEPRTMRTIEYQINAKKNRLLVLVNTIMNIKKISLALVL